MVLSTCAKEIHKNISRLRGYEPTSDFVERILDRKLYGNIAGTQHTDDAKVTDHYAIIPDRSAHGAWETEYRQKSVFDLIVRRFLSMDSRAEYQNVKMTAVVDVGENKERFYASARIKDTGYLKLQEFQRKRKKIRSEGTATSGRPAEKRAMISVDGYEVKRANPLPKGTLPFHGAAMENAGQLIEDEELREQIKRLGNRYWPPVRRLSRNWSVSITSI